MALTTVSSSMKERMNDLEKLKTDLADIRTFYNKKVSELENNKHSLVMHKHSTKHSFTILQPSFQVSLLVVLQRIARTLDPECID